LERRKRVTKILGHEDDINTVSFAERDSSHIFYSGSDDALCKVWDRRTFHDTTTTTPVGVLAGHMDGITCVTSKGDGRYFVSNGKDQTMKLWDIRKMKDADDTTTTARIRSHWDYRYQNFRFQHRAHPNDASIMTYVGHRILQTLIRCYFSPPMSTGQRFIYSGSADGSVYIYDILTGELVNKLVGHGGVVRDVSWHPYLPMLLSSSWDCSVNHWTYRRSEDDDDKPKRNVRQRQQIVAESNYDIMEDDRDPNWEDLNDDEDDGDYEPLSADESD